MSQKGFLPIPILIAIGTAVAVSIVVTAFYTFGKKPMPNPTESSMVSPTSSSSATPSATVATSLKPTPTKTATPKPTTKPTSTAAPTNNASNNSSNNSSSQSNNTSTSSQATSTPTPAATPYVSCEAHSDQGTASVGSTINFYYGASFYNNPGSNDYVTNVRWDWEGDGGWDTPYDVSQQHASHAYNSAGTYTFKLQLQTKNGLESGVCSASVIIN